MGRAFPVQPAGTKCSGLVQWLCKRAEGRVFCLCQVWPATVSLPSPPPASTRISSLRSAKRCNSCIWLQPGVIAHSMVNSATTSSRVALALITAALLGLVLMFASVNVRSADYSHDVSRQYFPEASHLKAKHTTTALTHVNMKVALAASTTATPPCSPCTRAARTAAQNATIPAGAAAIQVPGAAKPLPQGCSMLQNSTHRSYSRRVVLGSILSSTACSACIR